MQFLYRFAAHNVTVGTAVVCGTSWAVQMTPHVETVKVVAFKHS